LSPETTPVIFPFAAALELNTDGGDAVRVAVDSVEAPPELLKEAELIVDGPPGLREFLGATSGECWMSVSVSAAGTRSRRLVSVTRRPSAVPPAG
jgi:hypothetical protein